jgi:hypothetical protein
VKTGNRKEWFGIGTSTGCLACLPLLGTGLLTQNVGNKKDPLCPLLSVRERGVFKALTLGKGVAQG